MARQKGPLKYVGTLGEVRHFKIKGNTGYFAGLIGGPSGEQIKKDAAFKRTRENMNEFGASAMVGKSLRQSIPRLIKANGDSQVTGRLTAIMKKINLEDLANERGKRSILISGGPQHLLGFEFNKNTSFSGAFNADYTLTPAVGRESCDLAVPAFNPADRLFIPAGATHFRLVHGITVLSDFVYNPTTKVYEPSDGANNSLTNIQNSAYTPVNAITAPIALTAALPGPPTLGADVSVLNILAIEFFQEVGGSYYLFAQGNAMKIDLVF